MVTLILAIHNHQPVGNLDEVFHSAFRRCYAPVLEIFGRHPSVPVALHYSGPLLEWIEQHQPAHLRDLEGMVTQGQVEILGGGFYEPLLAAVPVRDARGQVAMMRDHWHARTGVRPRGLWLTERIWEPALPATLGGTGVAYTLVDDTHLRHAGLQAARFSGYYLTEKNGDSLALFPIDKQLRYQIPFTPAEQLIEELAAEADGTALTYGDDGEKFGVWPNTHEWVIQQGWLERLLHLLETTRDRVRATTPGAYLAEHPPTDRVYLPTAAYEEMMEWALPTGARRVYAAFRRELEERGMLAGYAPFVRGGVWDNFLVKYPESNQMHKRMLLVSERLARAEASGASAASLAAARRALYQGQCNCAYWHGLFGGLYVNYLRHATYERLIRADRLLDTLEPAAERVSVVDYDCDGREELVVTTPEVVAIIKPSAGAALVELDWKPADFNILNTLSRKREAYHERLLHTETPAHPPRGGIPSIHDLPRHVSPDVQGALVFDRHLRHAFIDHLWRSDTTLERLERGEDTDVVDLQAEAYELLDHSGGAAWRATLRWRGTCESVPLTLTKRYAAAPGGRGIAVAYALETDASRSLPLWFAVECNIALLAGYARDRYFEFHAPDGSAWRDEEVRERHLASRGVVGPLGAVMLVDEYSHVRVRLAASHAFELWRFPVETVSQSETGYERSFQESALYCHWRTPIAPHAPFAVRMALTIAPA